MGGRVVKQVVRAVDAGVNLVVTLLLLLMLLLGGYSLWDSNQVFAEASSQMWASYKPGPSAQEKMSFEELQALNPEIVAWIEVYGTQIDYPVAQATDNVKYVNYNAKGEYALSGCPFLDFQNAADFSDFNSIVYGHHMDVPAMFGELDKFESKEFFDSHQYGTLYYGEELHGIEFFAFLSTDAYNSAVYSAAVQGQQNQQAYLEALVAQAQLTRDIGVSSSDHIVILSTCSSEATDGRFVVAARITDTVQPNPFAGEKADKAASELSIWDYLRLVPWWAWLALIGLLLLCVIAAVRHHARKKEEREARANFYESHPRRGAGTGR